MKRYIVMCLSAMFMVAVQAVKVQRVYLKDGSVLSGYIQKQNTDGKLVVMADEALISVSGKEATIVNEQAYNENSLDAKWIKWAEENDAFKGVKGHRTLSLADVHFKNGKNAYKVRIVERGVHIKYVDLVPTTHTIEWPQVSAIRGEKRSKDLLSGIDRIYQLKNGSLCEGQYAEETDSTLSLYLRTGGIETLSINDVVKYTFKPVNPNQDIFEQSELLDVVKTNSRPEMRGIIIEQDYTGKSDTENFILIKEDNGTIQSVKVSDILETRKERNERYKPLTDVLLNDGEVMIGRKMATPIKVVEDGDALRLDNMTNIVTLKMQEAKKSMLVVVEYRLKGDVRNNPFQLVQLESTKDKKNVGFSYKQLVNTRFHAEQASMSANHTQRIEYTIEKNGTYVLYNAKEKKAYLFKVE